jgi:septal ring factor EnvC (AmiA/AmiB activator)
LAAAVIASALAVGPTRAQDAAETKLRKVEQSLESARSRAGRLETEMASISEEMAGLKGKLIDTASRIQAREEQITLGEARLVELGEEDGRLRERLSRRRGAMSEMLAALQKLEREPPPVLAVRPGDAVAAIRSAMLLSTVVPQIRAEAEALSRELRRLAAVREEVVEEQRQIDINRGQLEREHEVIERLLEVKGELASRTAEEIASTRKRAESLASEAGSLKELLARLEEERRRAEIEKSQELAAADARARRGDAGEDPQDEVEVASLGTQPTEPVASAEERRQAMARPDRLKAAVPFDEAHGLLPAPARGEVIRDFGSDDGYGGSAKGTSIETRARAQVTAPTEGWVVYAGDFRGYGQLLIIDAGDGYHVLLAGMQRIDASLGQLVLAGEPVGIMGDQAVQSAAIGAADGQTKPVLYVEFRKDGDSIDPQPWWAAANLKARG